MKLLLCQSCNEAFSIKAEPKTCPCGQTSGYHKGRKIFIEGPGKAFTIYPDDFWLGLRKQQIEDKHQTEPCSCKGQEFAGYFYPDKHVKIKKL